MKRLKRILILSLCLVLSVLSLAASADDQNDISGKTFYYAIVAGTDQYNVREGPGKKYEVTGMLDPGAKVIVLEEKDGWCCIFHVEGKRYVTSEALTRLSGDITLPEGVLACEDGTAIISTVITHGSPVTAVGEFLFNKDIDRTTTVLTDAATGDVLSEYVFEAEGRYVIAASRTIFGVQVPDVSEKMLHLRVTAEAGSESLVIYDKQMYVSSEDNVEYPHITDRCTVVATGENAAYLTDNYYMNAWTTEDGGTVVILPPDEASGGKLTVNWMSASQAYTIECVDRDGQVTMRYERDTDQRIYRETYDIPEETQKITIVVTGEGGIAELHVYEKGAACEDFEPLPESTDLLVFSAHLDDELLWFGGAIPYYTHQGKTVGVVYMTQTGWVRRNESLNAMWDVGMKYHPVYLDMEDKRIDDYDETVELWGYDTAMEKVVEAIRRYKPQVILTHDFEGEYGHNQHILTANILSQAVTIAADATKYPESAAKYGAWQVKKLYIHRYEKGSIRMNWEVVLDGEDGFTALDVAKRAYKKYVSQQTFYTMAKGRAYDYCRFGLYYSAVGEDVAKNDFFENIG